MIDTPAGWSYPSCSMPRNLPRMPFYMRALDGTITRTDDVVEWGKSFENFDTRRIDHTEFPDGSYVSTVFLGLDHSFGWLDDRPPVLFETMLFSKLSEPRTLSFGSGIEVTHDGTNQWRWRTEAEARTGHAAIVAAMHEALGLDALQLDADTPIEA